METAELTLSNLRTYYLVSGIANAVAAFLWAFVTFIGGIATCGLGCLLMFLPVINLVVMIFDFVAVSKVSRPAPGSFSFLRLTAILDMAAFFAIVPLIMGILSLQLLARPEIYRHFHPEPVA